MLNFYNTIANIVSLSPFACAIIATSACCSISAVAYAIASSAISVSRIVASEFCEFSEAFEELA